jgi:cob(I)alamin adenosyltransferase
MTNDQKIKNLLLDVQKDLLIMGAELSTLPEDIQKLLRRIEETDVRRLEELIDELQKNVQLKNEFIYPGGTQISAQIDVGRTIIRRAERKAAKLKAEGQVDNADIHKYLNRLADMLFVLARYEEQKG